MVKKKKKHRKQDDSTTQTITIEEERAKSEEKIDKLLEQLSENLSEEEMQMQKEALKKILIDGVSPKEAIGFSDDMIAFFYTEAYKLYQSGQYKKANQNFGVLAKLDPSPDHIMGLAASFHQMKAFREAVAAYLLLASIDVDSPLPFYHVTDCFIQQEIPNLALFSIRRAINRCGEDPSHSALKTRCYAMMSALEEQLGIEGGWQESHKRQEKLEQEDEKEN